jgi:hypothetical protein
MTLYALTVPRGYMEGPASEEREAELDRLERDETPRVEERLAVYGSTADDPAKHFLGWLGEVDPDALFAAGKAWGLSVVRRAL